MLCSILCGYALVCHVLRFPNSYAISHLTCDLLARSRHPPSSATVHLICDLEKNGGWQAEQ